ncbi:peptidoglycan-binding domain-containing protein [Agromyces atrinae]|uniref:Gas vesicle protein n=1 Tax=Agromyces atrinae TaxID=592376 RepID=A0A4Q2M4K3_9MICO|nr:hypothetical protein [Agromyces atrinae]NYD67354.1 gas vesicle protein [Agromyces atrinae]RXZ86819.1 hypothetical protein ESP50_07065 [Agromyces atrinae]
MRLSRAALLGVGVVVSAALGAASAALWLAPDQPPSLRSTTEIDSVPVIEQKYDDERSVELVIGASESVELTTAMSGRVTSARCTVGSELRSGESTFSIDGVPLVNLATRLPLWRDLRVGDRGDDVQAVQDELVRLGAPIVADGLLGEASVRALAQLADSPSNLSDGVIRASQIVWLPAATAVVASCDLSVGSMTEIGGLLGSLVGPAASVRVAALPTDLLDGDRLLMVDGVAAPISESGSVDDPIALAALALTPSIRAAIVSGDEAMPMSGSLVLASPADIAVVPPSSVYDIEGAAGCVLSEGAATAVEIVGSQLGQTFVSFVTSEVPRSVDPQPGSEAPPCR